MRISDWSSDVCSSDLLANIDAIARHGLMIGPDDRCVSWLPFYHDMGLVGFLLTPLCCAIPVDYIATREFARRPLTWLQLISRNRGTLSYSPSFGYELCARRVRSEEHTSELQSLMRISYAVFCLKKKKKHTPSHTKMRNTHEH